MKLNKKLILTLTAGVVATSVAVGGIFAWFTDTIDTAKETTFKTATVDLTLNSADPIMNAFYPGHEATIVAERELELNITDPATGKLLPAQQADTALREWWLKYNGSATGGIGSNWAFHSDHDGTTPYDNPADANKVHWLTEPGNNMYNIFEKVTPATFLYRNYLVTNDSNIPVYLRVQKAAFTSSKLNADLTQFANMVWMDGTNTPMVPYGDYFYCLNPIFPTADVSAGTVDGMKMSSILFHAYFAGNANGNDLQNTTITLLGGADAKIEIIQATNNAVYIESTWRDAADAFEVAGTPFVPYAPVTP